VGAEVLEPGNAEDAIDQRFGDRERSARLTDVAPPLRERDARGLAVVEDIRLVEHRVQVHGEVGGASGAAAFGGDGFDVFADGEVVELFGDVVAEGVVPAAHGVVGIRGDAVRAQAGDAFELVPEVVHGFLDLRNARGV